MSEDDVDYDDHRDIDFFDFDYDPEDCSVCYVLDQECPFHLGVGAGISWYIDKLKRNLDALSDRDG